MSDNQKIMSLAPEQEAMFDTYVDKWLKIGLSTEPVNFEAAKDAVCRAYANVGLTEPTQFFVADSPMSAIDIIQKMDPEKSKYDIFNEMFYGNHEASWLSFYDYFKEVVGLEVCKKLDPIFDLAQNAGWVSMYDDVVVFQHRPEKIKFDEQNRLHCEDGPAIRYRDGYGVYAWHGVRIPSEWIEHKADLTPKIALTWNNIEQRRCACEIIGWARILRELKSEVIDADDDPSIGTLLEVEIPDIGKEKFLQVLCGTGRTFALPVPPNMKTALEANAWTYGLDGKDLLNLEVRT